LAAAARSQQQVRFGRWTVAQGVDAAHSSDDVLVLSFASDTRIFSFGVIDEGIEELSALDGFRLDVPTLHAGIIDGRLCQVTKQGVALGGPSKASWQADDGKQTTVATDDGQHLLVASDGGALTLFDGTLTTLARAQLPNDISCITIHSFASGRKVAAVCTWASHELLLYTLPDLALISTTSLATNFLPRSILAQIFADGVVHLFIGLGDGTLVNFLLADDEAVLRPDSKKIVTLGQRPISMTPFKTEEGVTSVLVCSDRPTVVSRTSGRLAYASVNMRVRRQLRLA
jgi:hypothetical protein